MSKLADLSPARRARLEAAVARFSDQPRTRVVGYHVRTRPTDTNPHGDVIGRYDHENLANERCCYWQRKWPWLQVYVEPIVTELPLTAPTCDNPCRTPSLAILLVDACARISGVSAA